ncbi:mechanosensitive ion channel family protein [Methylophaga sp.]|uniref:mechanosensitive ion channel family protein n=1 Tax=Methylophaga sp. TaxID=2024840 RepID=UPI0027184CF3|nr:mechanosensitive ion channel family protein [Methylophaga sp.]MDO8825046.1 mechanosensitive ion channel family protein [Methylophaga sp.]
MFDWTSFTGWKAWITQPIVLNLMLVLGIAVISYIILRMVMSFFITRSIHWLASSKRRLARYGSEVFKHTSRLLIAAMALQIGLAIVELGPEWDSRVSHIWFLVLALQVGLWVDAAIALWKADTIEQKVDRENQLTVTIVSLLIRTSLWAVVLLSILANLGVNITALVASLGIGGIAIALALQTLLGDLFASASIGVDKPFKTGDFVVFNDVAGTIEYIGLKTTRIRSLSGEQIVCGNTNLLQQTIHNFKRMDQRRVVFFLSISFRTPVAKARQIPELIKEIIESIEKTRFDRAHLFKFDDYSMRFEIVYFVLSSDYTIYMDIQQQINFALLEELDNREIRFAMPVRSIEFLDEIPIPDRRHSEITQRPSGNVTS